MMKKAFAFITTIMVLITVSAVDGAITHTSVFVGMKIGEEDGTKVVGTDFGATLASVDVLSPSTGAQVSALLHIDELSAESANLHFRLSMDGEPGVSSLGQSSFASNYAEIFYETGQDYDAEFTMIYSWNFDYSGSAPFGLNHVMLSEGDTEDSIVYHGNAGVVGHYEGTESFNLVEDEMYLYLIWFFPNVATGENTNGVLEGDISLTFVPEPGTVLLLGIGGFGLLRKRLRW